MCIVLRWKLRYWLRMYCLCHVQTKLMVLENYFCLYPESFVKKKKQTKKTQTNRTNHHDNKRPQTRNKQTKIQTEKTPNQPTRNKTKNKKQQQITKTKKQTHIFSWTPQMLKVFLNIAVTFGFVTVLCSNVTKNSGNNIWRPKKKILRNKIFEVEYMKL